jgi:hypothetical protein
MTEINSGSGYAIVAAEGERGDGDKCGLSG